MVNYKQLCSRCKKKYIRFKTLTERQISAFKETVKKMKESK